MEEVLRFYKELRFVNLGNISDRLLKETDGDTFLAYNILRDTYELHSLDSFKRNRMSCNGIIEVDSINQELIESIKVNNIKRFGDQILSRREYMEGLLDQHDTFKEEQLFKKGHKMIRQSLGREI